MKSGLNLRNTESLLSGNTDNTENIIPHTVKFFNRKVTDQAEKYPNGRE